VPVAPADLRGLSDRRHVSVNQVRRNLAADWRRRGLLAGHAPLGRFNEPAVERFGGPGSRIGAFGLDLFAFATVTQPPGRGGRQLLDADLLDGRDHATRPLQARRRTAVVVWDRYRHRS
jgi:hypothetical protein